ncbi:uncharacterized protein TM35_000191330 [Trypanosoma theileri]|uniref:Nucleoporin n=1 Tax=Trypanosoma theileri TaxID=67003 RepID=A0A1X0NUL7_9TRYP|nr:uncharacterized protein TM35_000191330 [Trypanosoma theileri]ORC87889.1 hypothetical protein TM35_000191330 [Trypanosoma theileri]
MFAFAPPAKVARTQRSPLSSVEDSVDMSQLTAPMVAAADPFVSMGSERVRPTSMAEAEIRVGGVSIRPSVFLSGIGEHSCWIVDENTRLLRVWNMHKPFWQRSAPRMAQIPTFTRDEGLPLFVAELGPDEESLAFCTDYGAVSSLDHSVEFQFDCEDDSIIVSSFACKREEEAMLTAVGTTSGLVLVAVKTGGERIVLEFDRADPGVTVQTSPMSFSSSLGSWWRSWLPGLTSGKKSNNTSLTYSNSSVLSSECNFKSNASVDASALHEFTLLKFRVEKPTQLWAVSGASEVFLLDFAPLHRRRANDTLIRAKWGANISSVLQRQGRVVAFDESTTQLCCLVYLMPCNGHEASLELVMIDIKNGTVRQTLSMQSIGSLARTVAETPLHHTKVYLDETGQVITVLSGHYCVRINNNVSVRNPCSSEDVHMLRGIEYPLGSSLLEDGRIVTIDISGPIESVVSADEVMMDAAVTSTTVNNEQQKSIEACRMSHFTGRRENMANLTRNINSVLYALRIDARISIDSAVLEASEAICSCQRPHEGNWARADLNVEDNNMVAHVTNSLVHRQQEHRRFLLTVLLHDEIEPSLQPQTIAQLLSTQEALLGMVAIRRLQNDSSYPLSPTNIANTTATTTTTINNNNNNNNNNNTLTITGVEFDILTPLYRQTPASLQEGGVNSTVNDYNRLVRSSFEREKCQQLLREAVIRVADKVRSELTDENSVNSLGTAAEIVFGEPSRLCMLLQVLGEHLVETQRSVLMDHRTKFEEAMAVATIFLLIARAVDESRGDMAKFYTVPDSVSCMLWTSSEMEHYGIQLQMASACTTLSNALAEVVATSNNTVNTTTTTTMVPSHQSEKVGPSTWTVPLVDQLHLLDLIALVMHFSFRNHSQGSSSFYSDAMRCTLFREPFLREPLGYPFGAPKPASDGTLGATVLHLCQELALEFTAGDILVAICLAEPVENPLQDIRKYNQLANFCERNPAMFDIALHSLLSQRREWELQLLPELLPTYPSAGVARDAFLLRAAPHLAWLVVPGAFESLLADGLRPPFSSSSSSSAVSSTSAAFPTAPFAYGGDAAAHRSRCVALARLAWVAGGDAAGRSSAVRRLRLDSALVAAQRAWLLPDTRDVVLGAGEAVQRLLRLEKPAAWADAARIACHVSDELRSDLMTQIVRRAKQHDGEALSEILRNGASELEVARGLEVTAIGHVLLAASELQCTSLFAAAWTNVLDAKEQQLLSSWLQFRAAGLVS